MIKVKINGQEKSWDGDPDLSLLWYLRDEAGLTGTKYGCGQALCSLRNGREQDMHAVIGEFPNTDG